MMKHIYVYFLYSVLLNKQKTIIETIESSEAKDKSINIYSCILLPEFVRPT